MTRYVCIHGHFYQPPRENPWLEAIELQDSAYPYHDWNERITAECYAPNASSRILDGEGRIQAILNNYSRISFNFGPTLLSWLEGHNPDVYRSILEADQESQDRFGGHGSALAQVYNHMIMPLANRRDKETQVLWGVRDFEHRFGRRPEGMWLAETAVDLETLDILAAHGIRFTILSPYQAGTVRPVDTDSWEDARGGRIDPTRAYVQNLPSGRAINLFFYDAPVSQAVAFEKLLIKGETFAQRILSAFDEGRNHSQLLHIATDGESYGHHSAHGDMALAYALHYIQSQGVAQLTNYGEYLERHPPTHEVEIVENTSWSCVHGIERWQSNCGCNSGRPSWHQEWRGPLRRALDWLRDTITPLYEQHGGEYFRDPWAARDDYIAVILDRSPEQIEWFIEKHCRPTLEEGDRTRVLKLLEMQRHAMLMYTSCGWFFDELSGIETVQVIMYAGRVIHLAEQVFGQSLESKFLDLLELAKSNLPEQKDGKAIYEKWVKPAFIDWKKVGANYAISSLFEEQPASASIYCVKVESQNQEAHEAGKAKLVMGQALVHSTITLECRELSYGFLHFGDHNVTGGVSERMPDDEFNALHEVILAAFNRGDFPEIVRQFDKGFGGAPYSLKSVFRDEQRRMIRRVLHAGLGAAEETYRRLYQDHLPAMRFLIDLGIPLPRAFRMGAEFVANTDLRRTLEEDDPNFDFVRRVLQEAELWKVNLDTEGVAYRLREALKRLAERFREQPDDAAVLESLEQGVDLAHRVPFEVDIWQPQNIYHRMLQHAFADFQSRARQGEEAALDWINSFIQLGDKLGVRVDELKKKVEQLEKTPTVPRLVDQVFQQARTPDATYRLQFHAGFTFADGQKLVAYLQELGISDVYASPIKTARPGSMHGYDVIAHDEINPELGGEEGFTALAADLRRLNMGMILDTVPNHMGIGAGNAWWMDVLENGPSSIYARSFDIDWHPINPSLENRVLIPILEDQFGKVLESGKLKLAYQDGAFSVWYYQTRLPVAPGSYVLILEETLHLLATRLEEENEFVRQLQSIITAITYLPARTELSPEKIEERNREKEIIKGRIADLASQSEEFRSALEATVSRINGQLGDRHSFDLFDRLLVDQAYRPAFWRVAMEEINYRRFFDINDLAAIRMEIPEVFHATHDLLFRLLQEGKATGLRIDHPDGLWNPTLYFRDLQERYILDQVRLAHGTPAEKESAESGGQGNHKPSLQEEVAGRIDARLVEAPQRAWPLYVVAEKILAEGEPLPSEWAVAGTTGYDFMNLVNGIFVKQASKSAFQEIYVRFTGRSPDFATLISGCKKMVMLISMASEINSISHQLDRISERNRRYRDFTLNSLTFAIREIIAYLPIYRTYITNAEEVTLRDRMYIEEAVEEAKRRNPRTAEAVFDFIRDVVLLRNIEDFDEEDRPRLIEWTMKFQQITGPVMAKGVEDTAFYLYNVLVSLNEVGGHPDHFGISPADLHARNAERLEQWPHSMLGSTTHDTKRSEDVRARINVLSEIPEEWNQGVQTWCGLNTRKKTLVEGQPAPSTNDEYLLYQTLLGAWPVEPMTREGIQSFRERVETYMLKAIKEGKDRTSWVNPNEEYDAATQDFVRRLLPDVVNDPFVESMNPLRKRVTFFGFFNSLSQTLLKLTSPGVPDTYQGTELWDFSLVDPDNRRPVDYERRRKYLADIKQRARAQGDDLKSLIEELLARIDDGRIKLYLTWRTLNFRKRNPRLFSEGSYLALESAGEKKEHAFAFARRLEAKTLVVVVPRLVVGLCEGKEQPPLGEVWKDTRLLMPVEHREAAFRNLFTGEKLQVNQGDDPPGLSLSTILARFPVALLESGR